MSAREHGLYCLTCQRQTLHREGPGANHILHLLISLFTCGLWVFVWIFLTLIARGDQRWVCTFCGTAWNERKVREAAQIGRRRT